MAKYGLTPQGPNPKRLDVILEDMHLSLIHISSSPLVTLTTGSVNRSRNPPVKIIEGKLTVKGGIVARDDVKASNGSISLANHTHKGDSGGMTGKPQ